MIVGRSYRFFIFCCALVLAGSALITPGGLRAAEPKSPSTRLDPLLDRAATVVAQELAQLSEVECREDVAQTKFGKNGKVEYEENSLFDYVVLFQSSSTEPIMMESRLAKEGPKKPKNIPLLLTNGFSTLILIFHPYYSEDFQFADLGEESLDGRVCVKVHFQHVKGLRSTTALLLGGREYPLDLQGTAFVDKASERSLKSRPPLSHPWRTWGCNRCKRKSYTHP